MASLFFLLCLFLYLTLPLANAVADNVCDWVDAEPVLYRQYDHVQCQPHIVLQGDGTCPTPQGVYASGCGGFCQIRTNFRYGQEIPFVNAYCHGPGSCSIDEKRTQGVKWKVKVPLTISIPLLRKGINGGFNGKTNGITTAQKRTFKLKAGQCGYWTSLPIDKEVCGTQTLANKVNPKDDCSSGTQKIISSNEGNFCVVDRQDYGDASWYYGGTPNTVRADTIFVNTICDNRMRLPLDQQDPAYQHEGIPLDEGLYEGFSSLWAQEDVSAFDEKSLICQNELGGSAKWNDCQLAVADLLSTANETVPGMAQGDYLRASEYGSCLIRVEFFKDAGPQCHVSYAEVARSALSLLHSDCVSPKGFINAVRAVRGDEHCSLGIQIINPAAVA